MLREKIKARQAEYYGGPVNRKRAIIEELIQEWKAQGRRFLKMDSNTNRWVELPYGDAVESVFRRLFLRRQRVEVGMERGALLCNREEVQETSKAEGELVAADPSGADDPTCSHVARSGRAISDNLQSRGELSLKGAIPMERGRTSSCSSTDRSQNQLTGPIATDPGQALKVNLARGKLTGTGPPDLDRLQDDPDFDLSSVQPMEESDGDDGWLWLGGDAEG
jgi:hypothetical protein